MSIRKYRSDFPHIFGNDDFAWVDDWLNPFRATWTMRGQWVDPEKYTIVPRPEYRQTLIDNKQREIDSLHEEVKKREEELKELKKGL